jgi:hypothetical protein
MWQERVRLLQNFVDDQAIKGQHWTVMVVAASCSPVHQETLPVETESLLRQARSYGKLFSFSGNSSSV